MRHCVLSVGLGIGMGVSAMAWAAGPAPQSFVQGAKGVEITSVDVLADSKRMPVDMRDGFLAKKESVQQMSEALYLRRAIAQEARDAGVANDPDVAAQLRIATDKFLSEAYLAKFNAEHQPDPKMIESQVKAHYAAKKDSFTTPPELRVAHILVKGSDDAAKQKAEKLLAELKAGADFAQLAKENSEDPGSAAKGGDLGNIQAGRMVPEFEKAAFALKKEGELSPVVQSKFGYHILKALTYKPGAQRTFEEVKPELEKEYTNKALAAARQDLVDQLRAQAKFNEKNIEAFSSQYTATK